MIIDPYETTIGKIVVNRNLENELNKFLINTPDKHLGYEYKSENDIKYMFITGKNRQEEELPVFKHPVILNDTVRNDLYMFIDIRQFVSKSKGNDVLRLEEIIKDTSNFNILLIRAIYQDLLYHNRNKLRGMNDVLALSFATVVGGVLNTTLILNAVEMVELNITLLHYILNVLGADKHSMGSVVTRLSMARGNIDYVSNILSKLDDGNTIDVLASNISKCSTSSKLMNVNSDLILNLTRGIFYCDNSVELLAMMFEHPPTLLALLYSAMDDRVYKRSKLTTVLTNNKKRISLDNMVRMVTNTIKDTKI